VRKLNWDFINAHWSFYIEAGKITVTIGFVGILFSLLVGLLCSYIQYYKIPILKNIVSIYVELSRNTPLLIQLFFIYYGLPKVGIVWSAEMCAIIGLTFLGGSYMAESMRSGLEAIKDIQIQSGLSLGFTKFQVMRYIIFPQALAISFSSIGANIIFLLKETSVFSIIAIPDLVYVAKDLIGISYNTDEALFMLVISYFCILIVISIGISYIERRLRYATFGH